MINLIENLCRTCIEEEESVYLTTPKRQSNKALFSIFNGPRQTMACGSITIKELLKQATPQLSIDKDDLLPKSVCKNCLDKLVDIHQFQQKCLLAEQRLKDLTEESMVITRVIANEDDPLTNIKMPEEFADLHHILKIEIDEPLIDVNAQTNNDIAVKPNENYDDGRKENGSDDGEKFQSSDITSSKKTTRYRKFARNHSIENLYDSRCIINKLRGCEEKLFSCKECGSCLKTLKSLKRHEMIHYRPKVGRKKLKKREYQYADLDNSEEEPVGLHQLDTAIRQSSACKDLEILENNDVKDSPVCASKFDSSEPLLEMQDSSEEKLFACNQCDSQLKTRKSLNRHQKIHQRNQIEKKESKEPESACQFDSEENTDEDYEPHDDAPNSKKFKSKKPFKSKQTASKYKREDTQENANQHGLVDPDLKHQILSDDKPFECDECGSRVKTRKSLKRHKRIHLRLPGEKAQRSKTKYECKYCQKVFCQSSSLKDHMRVHTGEKPFLCSECGKAFKILSNMKQHFLRHGTDRPYECPDCPKKFPCLTDLASHAAVHNKAKTHVCDICGSAFVKPYLLKKHKMYHTGEKNHKCDYCDMRFVLAEQCRRHMRTHTGEKPYKCKYCSRAFAQSNDLTKHLRVHLGDSVYKCDLCPQGFRLLGDLRVHFNTHKNDDDETRVKNFQALKEDELRLQLRFGLVQTTEDVQ